MIYLLYLYLFVVVAWVLYLAAMRLKPSLKELRGVVRLHAYAVFLVAVLVDVAFNALVGTAAFLDLPRELLFTQRLKRYHSAGHAGTWRARVASWVCANVLDRFDPDGDHC